MSCVFVWHNLIFLIPLSLGVLLVFGAASGAIGDADRDIQTACDVDADAQVEADCDVGASDLVIEVLSLLGVGRVPLSIVVFSASLIFGTAGFIANLWLEPHLLAPVAFAPISLCIAFCAMFVLTGRVAALVGLVPFCFQTVLLDALIWPAYFTY